MKWLVLLTVFLCGCVPNAKVGDCILVDNTLWKITEEGKYSFNVVNEYGVHGTTNSKDDSTVVDCFDRFEGK